MEVIEIALEYDCGCMELMDPCGCVEVLDYCVPDMAMTKKEQLGMLKSYKADLDKESKSVAGQMKKLQKSK